MLVWCGLVPRVAFSFTLSHYFIGVFHRMCTIVSFVIPILETLAAWFALPALLYVCEVAEDGSVLAGVELELPLDGAAAVPGGKFFWSAS